MKFKSFFSVFSFTIFFCFFSILFFLNISKASPLGNTYLLFESLEISTPTSMVLLLNPNADFTSPELKISFSGEAGDWCVTEGSLSVNGADSTVIDVEDWNIDEELPGVLSGYCTQSSGGDYITVEGIEPLIGGFSYGVMIERDSEIFRTVDTAGEYFINVALVEGMEIESISFRKSFLESSQLVFSTVVEDSFSIICTLESNYVEFGALYKGGAYVTASQSITTQSTNPFYWIVYGFGGPGTADAGLYNPQGGGYLLSSFGVDGTVNLLTGEGFGMAVETSHGEVTEDFSPEFPGIFGSIGKGTEQSRLFLYSEETQEIVSSQVTYGARASYAALSGSYNETLTYVCGGYIENVSLEE